MENRITLPISLNPGLKAWGLITMNSLRKTLEENENEGNGNNGNEKMGGKKVKIVRNKSKKLNNKMGEFKEDIKGGKSFFSQLLMPNSEFDRIIKENK